ncbi:hypothetical protein ACJMK2_038769 [Sinanodonta woodiana]|uniref:Fibrinogen C-terminal domain-containing protein n=1 Tax=Sinanodonta woodiana TaxID=1069815 RepID=A0ABD3W9Z2_SINWO
MSDECKINCENGRQRKLSTMAGSTSKEGADRGFGSILLHLATLGIAAGLVAAVWYQLAGIAKDIESLYSTLEKSSASPALEEKSEKAPDEPRDCYDIFSAGNAKSGMYTIYPHGLKRGLPVFCDMDTDGGGWLVFQRRQDGEQDFHQKWEPYQFGFGNQSKEFWLGNEYLHLITSQGLYELRIDMESFDFEEKYAKYKIFHVGSRDEKFKLSISGFSGDVDNSFSGHNGQKFSTDDQDNDLEVGSCASAFKGGWWYSNCLTVCLNGQYLGGKHESKANGIHWMSWTGIFTSLKWTEMKIRPVDGTTLRT